MRTHRVVTGILLVLFVHGRAYGGDLRDFENDVTRNDSPSETPKPPDTGRGHGHGRDDYHGSEEYSAWDELGDNLLMIVPIALLAGGAASWQRVTAPTDGSAGIEPRLPNEPLIPFFRIDGAYQMVSDDVYAWEGRLQAGFGPFAVEYDFTRFHEDDPEDRMEIRRLYGLYRMCVDKYAEFDLGIGQLTLDGATATDKLAFTTPLLVYPEDWWGVEFRPSWSRFEKVTLQDYDLGVFLNWKGASLKAGYRWVLGHAEDLSGPYVGLAYRY